MARPQATHVVLPSTWLSTKSTSLTLLPVLQRPALSHNPNHKPSLNLNDTSPNQDFHPIEADYGEILRYVLRLWTVMGNARSRRLAQLLPSLAVHDRYCMLRFNGNRCTHFTKSNDTDVTRVSFDFRAIPCSVHQNIYDGKIGDYNTKIFGSV